MKYVSEFRNAELARAVAAKIATLVDPHRHYKIMEVCGGHTHTIYRHGIKDLLPEQIELVHGPGCPVCVLPMGRVDDGIAIAERPEVIFTCFGDMMRVPGSKGNLLQSILMLMRQLAEGRCEVENQYSRIVPWEGNLQALRSMAEVFELRPYFEWRGLGFIAQSALKLAPAYSAFDAELRYAVPGVRVADPKACQCGEVLKGVLKPWQCKVFGTACTPEHPLGTLMVSSEGACAAYYNFGRTSPEKVRVGA